MSVSYALQQLLFTVILPVVVSGGLYLLLRKVLPELALTLAVIAGYLSGHVALQGLPKFPPSSLFHYFPYLALVAILWLGLEKLWAKNPVARWGLRSLILLASYVYMLRRIIQNSWQLWETVAWFVGLLLVLLLVWWVLERLSQGERPLLPPTFFLTALVILVVGSSITISTAGSSVRLGQLGGVLAASIGAVMVLSWFIKVEGAVHLATAFIFLQGTMWLGGATFSKLPVISGVILALSLCLLLLLRTPQTFRSHLLRLVFFAIPIVVVVGFAVIEFLREPPF
jgi:hypothetical protein